MCRPINRRDRNDRLHFDGSGRWLKWLLLTGLLLAAAGHTLQQQQNEAFIALRNSVSDWLQANTGSVLVPRKASSQGEVTHLIRLANDRLEALKLSFPAGDSALHYFREALKLQPDSTAARQGISEIVHWYIEQAEQAIRDGDLQLAARYTSRGRSINKYHPKLMALQQRLHPSSD